MTLAADCDGVSLSERAEEFLPLAYQAARCVYRRHTFMDLENLKGQAALELLRALPKFDAARLGPGKTKQGYLVAEIRNRLLDYVRSELGRRWQKRGVAYPARFPHIKGLYSLSRKLWQEGDSGGDIASTDAVEKLLQSLSKTQRVAIRCLLDDDSITGTRKAMEILGLSESRVSQLRTSALKTFRKIGRERVQEILFGRDEA